MITICEGCGAELEPANIPYFETRLKCSKECKALFDIINAGTLSNYDPEFIHQYVVDIYNVQHYNPLYKNISLVFGLTGLYLYNEMQFTGRQIQNAHSKMADTYKNSAYRTWAPSIARPIKYEITVKYVIDASEKDRIPAIRIWSVRTWEGWKPFHHEIQGMVKELLTL